MVETKRVTDRRELHFEKLDDELRDAEMLAEAERGGTLRATGNWSLGQAIGHLAFGTRAPFEGYPPLPPQSWPVRLLVSMIKHRIPNRPLRPGVRFAGAPEGTFGTAPMPTGEALAQFRRDLDRLAKEAPPLPHPILGKLTHEQWIQLNLRHAELHLSFFHPA